MPNNKQLKELIRHNGSKCEFVILMLHTPPILPVSLALRQPSKG